MAVVVMATIPILVLYLFFQRYFVEGIAASPASRAERGGAATAGLADAAGPSVAPRPCDFYFNSLRLVAA